MFYHSLYPLVPPKPTSLQKAWKWLTDLTTE